MRLFLCGGGDGTQTASAYKKLNKIINHTRPLLYIPLAMESNKYPSCLEWITNELKELNIPNIEMITQASEILNKNLTDYCAIFVGGGNTFKLLNDLKTSGAFEKIQEFINNNGIVFGGSAGAIIFGNNLKSCALDDDNVVNLEDISGYDVLNGCSILCHYTNRTKEKDEESKKYLLNLSKEEKIIALPEEDTIYINDAHIEVIGTKPYYIFDNGAILERNPSLPEWQFGIDNDNLVELVLQGKKTATTSLDTINISRPGERSILTFENEKKACIIETKKVIITQFKNITPEMAFLEGEGNRTLDYYKKAHMDYFKTINPNFNDETEVCFEIFEVIEDLRKTRLTLAEKIVKHNEQIFGNDLHTITEINAGFNNDLFDIDNTYIIKVCGNGKEDKFEKENQFYIKNFNSTHIPKLYKYDNTKTIVDSVYEIISKIEGKSLYYYWYKMDENEREAAIKELIGILKDIHNSKCEPYNWTNYIKSQIQNYYKETKKYFSTEEQKLIEQSFTNYDKYLKDNKFAFIHNDLHFDNILKNDNGLYLIDFNDAMVAPIDYEFRLLYRCKDMPWKWANSEMDPFQKPEDYKNIDSYIKKYYKEFSDIKYIDERMIIYNILDDMRLLTRFNNNELNESIVHYTKKLFKLN